MDVTAIHLAGEVIILICGFGILISSYVKFDEWRRRR